MPFSIVSADIKRGRLVRLLANYTLDEMGVYAVHVHGRHVPANNASARANVT